MLAPNPNLVVQGVPPIPQSLVREVEKYTDEKEGIVYTFVGSHLKTTRYAYSEQQLARIQQGKM